MAWTPLEDCVAPDRSSDELRALKSRLVLRQRHFRTAAEHYSLLAGETRLKIMVLLEETGELCVCDLASILDMTPAAVSQHLSRLRSAKFVSSRRDGMTIYYQLTEKLDRGLLASLLIETAIKGD